MIDGRPLDEPIGLAISGDDASVWWEPNPTTPAKVELGRRLFYDVRLSKDGSMACSSCHEQARAFTDGRPVSPGVTGQTTPRNAMSLANAGYAPALTWANPLLHSLEQQAR